MQLALNEVVLPGKVSCSMKSESTILLNLRTRRFSVGMKARAYNWQRQDEPPHWWPFRPQPFSHHHPLLFPRLARCPVCRYCQTPEPVEENKCFECGVQEVSGPMEWDSVGLERSYVDSWFCFSLWVTSPVTVAVFKQAVNFQFQHPGDIPWGKWVWRLQQAIKHRLVLVFSLCISTGGAAACWEPQITRGPVTLEWYEWKVPPS